MVKVVIAANIILLALLFLGGCEPPSQGPVSPVGRGDDILCAYTAQAVSVIGLTEMVEDHTGDDRIKVKVYLELLDSAGSSIKAPGTFRFELYEFVPRSAQPKGKRIVVWTDLDLTGLEKNNHYWQDFLRAYRFDLGANFKPSTSETYMLEATCMTGAGTRLNDVYQLKYSE